MGKHPDESGTWDCNMPAGLLASKIMSFKTSKWTEGRFAALKKI